MFVFNSTKKNLFTSASANVLDNSTDVSNVKKKRCAIKDSECRWLDSDGKCIKSRI